MSDLFLKIINMSISASWLILTVLILRFALKKAPKWVNILLWGIVAVRLICPFSFESALSLIPSVETIPMNIEMDATPAIDSGITAVNRVINPMISASFTPSPIASANPLQIWIPLAAVIWFFGIVLMLLYTILSYWRLHRKIHTAVLYKDNIFQSEHVGSPFVLGIIKPRIYLPFTLDGQDLEHVVSHEQAHIHRKDHWWKPLGFLLLTIHWFNPLMWLAYMLLCRDIELACDEKVIKDLGNEQRADYTQALVACAVNRRRIAACPLAFGEVGVKERVQSVMNYRKPAFWIILVSVIACIVVAVCFLTNPKQDSFSLRIVVPAGSQEAVVYAEEEISPIRNHITVTAGDGLGDTQVSLKPVEVKTETAYDEPAYLTPGVPVNMDAEKGGWFKIGVTMQNDTDEDITVFLNVKNIEVRIASESVSETDALDAAISSAVLDYHASDRHAGLISVESHVLLSNEVMSGTPMAGDHTHAKKETVYLLVLHEVYNSYGGTLESVGGSYIPTAITFSISDTGAYTPEEYWIPRDGSYYADDIRNKFPGAAADEALNDQAYIEDLEARNYSQALAYLNSVGSLDMTIEKLLDAILTSPSDSSNPSDYTNAHESEYQELLSYGEYTLRYCFSEFLQGGQTDLRGQIMAGACEEISISWGETLLIDGVAPATGQEWFDAFRSNTESLSRQFDDEDLEKNYPASWLLLQMM